MNASSAFASSSAASAFHLYSAQQPSQALPKHADTPARALAAAQDFEAVFLNSMFSQMFTAMDGEGPLGGSGSVGIWRSFLSEEYSKNFAKAGGIGIAKDVYRFLLEQQEASAP